MTLGSELNNNVKWGRPQLLVGTISTGKDDKYVLAESHHIAPESDTSAVENEFRTDTESMTGAILLKFIAVASDPRVTYEIWVLASLLSSE